MYYEVQRDALQHHGILGMKWGVRRYQNPDGTLTKEGRQRLNTAKTKTLNKLNRRSESEKAQAKRDAESIKDVKKNGSDSTEVQVRWAFMDNEEKNDLAERGGFGNSLRELFTDAVLSTPMYRDKYALEQLTKETISDLKQSRVKHIQQAENFAKRYEDLTMKDIDELVSKYGYKEAKRQIKRS